QAIRYSIETSSVGRSTTDVAAGISREVGGRPFDIYIKALDALNNVDPNFVGQRSFYFVSNSLPSWTGQMPVLPDQQEITCTFTSGVCVVPRSTDAQNGWTITDASRASILNIVETTLLANIPSGSSKIGGTFASTVFMSLGVIDRVLLADLTGGPTSGAKIISTGSQTIRMTIDEHFIAYPVLVDAGGNYKGELTSPVVQGDATYVQPFLTLSNLNGGVQIVFAPKLKTPRANPLSSPTGVEIRFASSDSTVKPFSGTVAIYHGVPSKSVINLYKFDPTATSTVKATQLVAGECYRIEASVMDSNDNEIDTLSGTALTKLGVKNFSVSSNYLNFNGGFYTRSSSGNINAFRFSTSDPMFSGSEFKVRNRKVNVQFFNDYTAGGITAFNQALSGVLTNNDNLLFCQSDASNGATLLRPQFVMQLVAGLSYLDKAGKLTLAPPLSGNSLEFSVVPGPAAALQFFMKLVDSSGNQTLGPPLCNLSAKYDGPYNYGSGLWITPQAASAKAPQLFNDNDLPDCIAMNADSGGLNIVAKVTDVAGNVLSNQTANGTWTFLDSYGSTGFAAPSKAGDFTQTGNTYRDPNRKAGVYSFEYSETTTGLKAKIVAKVKAGRAGSFNFNGPPTVVSTEGFNIAVDFRDNWGNNFCEGFRGFNGEGFGLDPVFGMTNNSSTVSIRWTDAIPTTPKFPMGGVLGNGTAWNTTY
ncbi:hypothetical protein EBR21_13215, partial [bacterium]|nr:hypothetical protein [bacterium]